MPMPAQASVVWPFPSFCAVKVTSRPDCPSTSSTPATPMPMPGATRISVPASTTSRVSAGTRKLLVSTCGPFAVDHTISRVVGPAVHSA